jgi:adenylate cyclase
MQEHRFLFDRFEVRPAERALLADGQPVELGARAFDLLLALLTHRDRVVGKDELMGRVWPGVVVEENNLQVQISALRKILGPQAIATIPGRGYQFVAPIQSGEPQIYPEQATSTHDDPPTQSVSAKSPPPAPFPGETILTARSALIQSRWRLPAAAALVFLAVALTVGWYVTDAPEPKPGDAAPVLSIVVAPFANHTGDAGHDHIADGLTTSLITDLARLQDTIVISAATAFTYKGRATSAQQLGRELQVRYVLQGSVQRSGSRLRINTQLADTATDSQLWSTTIEGDQSDLFALQDSVIARVSTSIGREMVRHSAHASRDIHNPTATDLLLRARALRPLPQSAERHLQSIEWYRRVLELEPDNARAMTGLARSLVLICNNFGRQLKIDKPTAALHYQEAHRLAVRAMQIDPRDEEIYMVLANYAAFRGNREGSRQFAETRLAKAPRSLSAHNDLAVWHFYAGNAEQAIALLKKGLALDPLNTAGGLEFNLGRAYFMSGDYDQAIHWLHRSKTRVSTITTTHAYLAMAYAMKGDERQAAVFAAELREAHPDFNLSYFSRVDDVPQAFEDYWQKRLLPAAKKAGLVG